MENDKTQLESVLDSKIRLFLLEEGYILPLTDAEIESAMHEFSQQDVTIPSHLDDPFIYLSSHAKESILTINPLSVRAKDDYLDNFTALAAREGTGDIPAEILEQMKKDREGQSDE